MTKKELYTNIKAYVTGDLSFSDETVKTEFTKAVLALCDTELKSLARAAERAAEKRNEKKAADEPLIAQITEMIEKWPPVTASDVAGALHVTVQKASSLLRGMNLKVEEMKVPKKGTVKVYSKAE